MFTPLGFLLEGILGYLLQAVSFLASPLLHITKKKADVQC